ncbi:MAG: nitroreductase family protein [Corynebacterium sp.]|nr:nitroreductase family protein [Corynebacterium sp.]
MTNDFLLDDAALDALFTEAYSTTAFDDRPVPDAVLERAVELMKFGPTWMNSQPLRIIRISQQRRAAAIASMWERNQPKAQAAPEILLLAADTNFYEYLTTQAGLRVQAAQEQYAKDLSLRTEIALQSANLQAGYLLLALRSAGLGIRPIGGYDPKQIAAEYLAEGEVPLMVYLVGYPAAENSHNPRGPRLETSKVYRED